MEQESIPIPEVTKNAGYSLLYRVYLYCGAWLLRKAVALTTSDGSVFTKHIFVETPGLGEGRVKCSICIPSKQEQLPKLLPLVLVFEGGGFVLGQPTDGERHDRFLSDKLSAVVISVDYAKAPRYPFPHALLQIHHVLTWSLSSLGADELGVTIDASRVAIMGNSAGGNLTAALTLLTSFTAGPCMVFREKLPKNYRQVAQILIYPSTACHQLYRTRLAGTSVEVQAKSLPVWVAELMEGAYLPPSVEKEQIFVGPVLADVSLLKILQQHIAPVTCLIAGMDSLKDEALQYCRHLEDAGVSVVVKEYPEAIHGFSHFKDGNKNFRKDDAEDCWRTVADVLAEAFYGTI